MGGHNSYVRLLFSYLHVLLIARREGVAKKGLSAVAQLTGVCLIFATGASAQAKVSCVSFTVVVKDKLSNVKEGLSPYDAKWFQEKMANKYPRACYVAPSPTTPVVFYITITPDTYHGTKVVTDTSTETNPITGTVTDRNGNTSDIDATVKTTTSTSTAVPYSFEYGIFTLSVERLRNDGTFEVVQTFQQRGIYNTYLGIPLGGRGHHPAHAVIEDAAKWINSGGLGQSQSIVQPPGQNSTPSTNAATTLQTRAIAGEAGAQDGLGLLYATGNGVPQDDAQAAVWYRKAAEQGNADAQLCLAYFYFAGQGVPQDYAQAVFWYRKAADQGDSMAQFSLGLLYSHGQGVPQDDTQAAFWYRKAAEQGDASAQFRLGHAYAFGYGVSQDSAESYFWLDIAVSGKLDITARQEAIQDRDLMASHLTPVNLSQAQARASAWFVEHSPSK